MRSYTLSCVCKKNRIISCLNLGVNVNSFIIERRKCLPFPSIINLLAKSVSSTFYLIKRRRITTKLIHRKSRVKTTR